MVQVTWSNTVSDTPIYIKFYNINTNYIVLVTHTWSVTQIVRFIYLIVTK